MKRVLFVLAFVLSTPIAQAQAPCTSPSPQTTPPTYTCQTGSARTLLWDYTDVVIPGDAFRVYVNDTAIGADMPARAATGISVQFGASLPVGTYTVSVATVRPGAALPEAKSAPLTLVLVSPPPPNPQPPSNLRVVEVIMRGLDHAGNVLSEHTERLTAQVGQ